MSIPPVTSSSAIYTAPPTTAADPVTSTVDTTSNDDDYTSTVDTTSNDDDYSSYWNQFEKDCCTDTMNQVNQVDSEEKKNDKLVYGDGG